MKNITLSIFAIFLSLNIFGQSKEVLLRQKNIQQQEAFDNLHSTESILPSTMTVESRTITDSDEDGMDDEWETANGLDPNNPKDAYYDKDGDHTINIYEFTLDSDPNDVNSPPIINVNENTDDLEQVLLNAPSGSLVRIPTGVYDVSLIRFLSEDFAIMIQGGWNSDFTEYAPDEHPVLLDNNATDETIYYSQSGNYNLNLVIDGITIQNSFASTFSAITLVMQDSSTNQIAIGNCHLINNNSHAMTLNHWDGTTNTVHLHKLVLANNIRGISAQITNGSKGLWTIDNVTVTNNNEEGIRAFTLSDEALLTSFSTNSIFDLNRGDADFEMRRNMKINLSYSKVGILDVTGAIESNETNQIIWTPEFNDIMNDDYSLLEGSSFIDAGTDIGLAYNDSAPDVGAIESGLPSSTVDFTELAKSIYPNPTKGVFNIELLKKGSMISILSTSGSVLSSYKPVEEVITIDLSHFTSGLYIVKINAPDGSIGISKVSKI